VKIIEDVSKMSDPEPIDHIMKRMKKKYDEDKETWNVISSEDRDGNREMLINHAPNTWWLKMKQVNPYNYLSAGKELHNIDDEINERIGKSPKLDPQKERDEIISHRARFDQKYFPISILDHIKILKETGFKVVELFWLSYMQAGFYAIK